MLTWSWHVSYNIHRLKMQKIMAIGGMSRCHPPCSHTYTWKETEKWSYSGAHSSLLLAHMPLKIRDLYWRPNRYNWINEKVVTKNNFTRILSEGKLTTGLLLYNSKETIILKSHTHLLLSLIKFTALHKLLNHELTSVFD